MEVLRMGQLNWIEISRSAADACPGPSKIAQRTGNQENTCLCAPNILLSLNSQPLTINYEVLSLAAQALAT